MNKWLKISWSDFIGILSSSLCLIHCLATPILITVGIGFLDNHLTTYFFLVISFLSIYKATQNCKKPKISFLLWGSFFGFLFSTLLHQYFEWLHTLSYLFAIAIIYGHILNIKHCKSCNQ